MIDLHLHTTASDGNLCPRDLVRKAQEIGIRTLSVTDHDTMAGVQAASKVAAEVGLEFLPGIEVTAVLDGRDVHILGYFLDPSPPGFESFLQAQRDDRVLRARNMGARLSDLGVRVDVEAILSKAEVEGRAVTRPLIARALVDAGHSRSQQEVFDRWLGDGRPAYVERNGISPVEVVRLISRAGGVSGLAHPGLLNRDDLIPGLAEAGLDALEVFHSAHDQGKQAHYTKLAKQHGLSVCGGSDYHGEDHHRAKFFGKIGLPKAELKAILHRLRVIHSVVHGEER